jgi:hypothetical protein
MLDTLAVYREGQTGFWSGQIEDRDKQPVPLADILHGTIELRDDATGEVVNDRSSATPPMYLFADAGAVVSGPHGVNVSPTGAIWWEISADDTTVPDPRADLGEYQALFRIRYTQPGAPAQELVSEHRLLIWRRPMICTTSDVRAIFTAWSESYETRAPVWIAAVTEFFEEYAERKILKLDAGAPEREIIPLSTGGTYGGRRTIRLRRYPVDEVLAFGFSPTEGDPLDPDWDNLPLGLPSNADLDALTGRIAVSESAACQAYVEYTGGMAVATGGLPRDLRQMCALQVGFILQNEHRLGVQGYSSGAQPGAATNFVQREGFLLPEVKECFDRHRRLS